MVEDFCKKYETTRGKDTRGINKNTLKEALLETDSEAEVRETFLMYAICSVLCPSTIDKVQSKYLGLVSYAQDSKRYDWSTIVLNDLKRNLKKFISTFNKQGYTKSCGGCVFVLLVSSLLVTFCFFVFFFEKVIRIILTKA